MTRRHVLDRAMPLRAQAADWAAAADRSEPLSQAGLASALAGCQAAAGLVVSFSHDDYIDVFGGVQNVIADERLVFESAGWHYLHVAPAAPLPTLARLESADEYRMRLRLDGECLGVATFPVLAACLAALHGRATRLEFVFHHLKGHVPEWLATLPLAAATRPIVWVHDFFTLCPNFNLMRNDVKFCGAPSPDSAACTICVFGVDRSPHLPRMRAFFETTRPIVLAPSAIALELWSRQGRYRYDDARVMPLARLVTGALRESRLKMPGSAVRVAYIGAPVSHKGWQVFADLAGRHARNRRYKFYHFGTDNIVSRDYRHVPVRVGPRQRHAMVEALVTHRIDVVLIWSLWPETFCFTAYEALAAGAFLIVRRDAGNVWPMLAAHAPAQGHAVDDEAGLFKLFDSGELRSLVSRSNRHRGTLRFGANTAGYLLEHQTVRVPQENLEVVGR